MSVVTSIFGFIEINGNHTEHNSKILEELEHDEDFIKMFCNPEETGTKNPDYILFGASLTHFIFETWLDRFEEFIKELKAFNAFVFVDTESGGDKVFCIGYELDEGKFIRDIIDFGDGSEYSLSDDDNEDSFSFPALFRVLKFLDMRQRQRILWDAARTNIENYVACDKCGIILALRQEGKDICERCGSPYIQLNNYIVAVEHSDSSQEFAIVPGRTPEDALKRLSGVGFVMKDVKRTFVGKHEI